MKLNDSTAFWCLCSPESARGYARWRSDDIELEQIVCSVNSGHQRAGARKTPLSVILDSPIEAGFVWTWQGDCLITDEVLQMFRENNFTGFKTTPVKVSRGKNSIDVSNLHELQIVGWGGVAPTTSGVRLTNSCAGCSLLEYSCFTDANKLISTDAWDGSDFFIVWPLPRYVFITDRVATAIKQSLFSNVRLQHLGDLKCPDNSMLSPGRLSYWMPKDDAVRLGGDLDIA